MLSFRPELTCVPDPGCLSRIPDQDLYPSRIPDPKTAAKEWGEKNLLSYLFWLPQIHKIENYFIFEMLKKKILGSFQRILDFFTQKFVPELSKILSLGSRIQNQGSGKNLFRTPDPDPGVNKAHDPGSGSATLHLTELRCTPLSSAAP